jgi:hypothetical protein
MGPSDGRQTERRGVVFRFDARCARRDGGDRERTVAATMDRQIDAWGGIHAFSGSDQVAKRVQS